MNKPLKKGGKGECQLLRGHQFKVVSGQGKWQEWMPKLERSRSDLRKPCHPQHAGIPVSEDHESRSHPDDVWFRRDGRALLRGGFSEPPKPQGTWKDRGQESIDHSWFCYLLSNMLLGRSASTQHLCSSVNRGGYPPQPHTVCDLHLHRCHLKY